MSHTATPGGRARADSSAATGSYTHATSCPWAVRKRARVSAASALSSTPGAAAAGRTALDNLVDVPVRYAAPGDPEPRRAPRPQPVRRPYPRAVRPRRMMLDGPSSDRLIDPWGEHLRRLGVELRLGRTATGFD